MSKGLWSILVIGFVSVVLLVVGMMISLTQFQKASPGVKFVKLAEQISNEFKLETVSAEMRIEPPPGFLRISYLTHVDSKFDLMVQNGEMKRVAEFALKNYQGSDRSWISEVQVHRSEIHGSGCFQQTYLAHFSLPNSYRSKNPPGVPGMPLAPPREK